MIIVFNYTLHQRLWNWLAEHPGLEKWNWPGWKKFGYFVPNLCFACEAAMIDDLIYCEYCPLYWNEEDGGMCERIGTFFNAWRFQDNISEGAKYAKAIAGMKPFKRKGVKELIVI